MLMAGETNEKIHNQKNIWSKRITALGIASTILILDQLSKSLVVHNLKFLRSYEVLDGFFRLTYIRNPNSIFGISLGSHFPYVWISLAASIMVLFFLLKESRWRFLIVYALLLGGALGNMLDRLRWGEVVDFIDIGISNSLRWAVFNVADSAVTISLIALLILLWRE